jgi:hypothetical protein
MVQPRKMKLISYYYDEVEGTYEHQRIKRKEFLIGRIYLDEINYGIYISSWALKHIYDRRPLVCKFFINHSYSLVSSPDSIYLNKAGKNGKYIFISCCEDIGKLCVVLDLVSNKLCVLTAYPVSNRYLDSMKLIKQRRVSLSSANMTELEK